MHILHFISAYGPTYVANAIHRELGEAMIARGHRYSVLTLAGHQSPPGLHRWEDGSIAVYAAGRGRGYSDRIESELSKWIFHYPPFLFLLRSYGHWMRNQFRDVDLVVVEGGYPLGAIAALWKPVIGYPLVVVLQGGDMHREERAHYGFGRFASARWLLRLTLRRSDMLRTYSPLARDAAIERGADPTKIVVVAQNIGSWCYLPPHVDATEFRASARAAVTARHHLRGHYLLVGVGRLLPIKGFEGFVRALPTIEQHVGKRVEVILCGPSRPVPGLGDYRTYLERVATNLSVGDRLHFTGELLHTEVREYLAAADLLVIPSVMEGGAKVLMEGAAVGTPFVATETAGTPAFLPDGGFTVPPLAIAPAAFPRAVAVLLKQEDLRSRLGRRALEQSSRFSAESRADELLPLYISVVRSYSR